MGLDSLAGGDRKGNLTRQQRNDRVTGLDEDAESRTRTQERSQSPKSLCVGRRTAGPGVCGTQLQELVDERVVLGARGITTTRLDPWRATSPSPGAIHTRMELRVMADSSFRSAVRRGSASGR